MFSSFIYLRKSWQISALLLLFAVAAFAQERTWKTFSPDSGDWSILAPGIMRNDPNAIETLGKKGGYSYTDATGFFAVVYENSPGFEVALYKPFLNSHYRKIRNSFVKSSKGKLLKDENFKTIGGDKGREFFVQIPDGSVLNNEGQLKSRYKIGRFRIFFHGNRCYMLLAVLPEDEVYTFPINDYFTSFAAKR